jgi:hypothetical protein
MVKKGSIKVETENGTEEIPVFETSDVDNSAWRVQTETGTGAIRLVDPSNADIPAIKLQTNNGIKSVATSLKLTTSISSDFTLNNQNAELTVYEDLTGNGTADNTETVQLQNGTTSYDLSNLQGGEGNTYWIQVNFDNPELEKTAEINQITLETGEGIPDSIIEFKPSNFDGSQTTWKSSNLTESLDFYVDTPTETTFSNGDVAVDSNDGLGILKPPSSHDGSSLQKFSVEVDFQTTTGSDPALWGFGDSDGKGIRLGLNEGNDFFVRVRDNDSNVLEAQPSNTVDLTDGTRRKLTVAVDGPSNNVKIIIDGEDIPVTYNSKGSPNITNNLQDVGFGFMGMALHYENGGNSRRNANGKYGVFRLHNEFITSQTI